jgi:hypothetical protein
MVRRFVHFGVICIAKYQYGENIVANPNFLKIPYNSLIKSPDIGLKMP